MSSFSSGTYIHVNFVLSLSFRCSISGLTDCYLTKLCGLFRQFQNYTSWLTTGAAITGQKKVTYLLLISSVGEYNICRGQMLLSAVALSLFFFCPFFSPQSSHCVMHPTVIICSQHFKPNSKRKKCVCVRTHLKENIYASKAEMKLSALSVLLKLCINSRFIYFFCSGL